ncbi:MAG TPA: hypothetical protein VFW25_15685 [Silvibacterium sp.]|nr:hypothetical protein [Silvibacterium sp.]
MIAFSAALGIVGASLANAGSHSVKKSSALRFLIDPSKPYVYLEVDHIGPRQPELPGEPSTGIWLRFHNNCILPITVVAFGAGVPPLAFTPPSLGANQEVGVYDAVIANAPAFGSFKGGSVYDLPGYPSVLSLAAQLWGKPRQPQAPFAPSPPAQPVPKPTHSQMPSGYWADVGTLTTIEAGHSIYFSLPRNHVSTEWHVEIPFDFDLGVRSPIPSPHGYVTLYEDQVAEKEK